MLASFLFEVKDHRRKEGQRYQLGHILFFSVLAILSGADSYRSICTFVKERYHQLHEWFNLNWKQCPAHTTIRNLIKGTSPSALANTFRAYRLQLWKAGSNLSTIAVDGKVLKGSFDRFHDRKAAQILSAFLVGPPLILAHEDIDQKTNEIPTAQELIEQRGVSRHLFTFDALHCQKKP